MSSNKYLSAFFTSAAALGGLYLLDRFLGGEARANPKVYKHRRTFDIFSDQEKSEIVKRYIEQNQSIETLAKEFKVTPSFIRKVLVDRNCALRDNATAVSLAKKKELAEHQKTLIRTLWGNDDAARPTIQSLADAVGVYSSTVSKFLIEEGLHEARKYEELTDDDKDKLVAAKKTANTNGVKLNLRKIGKELGLSRTDIPPFVILRFFAEKNLNCYWDYTGNLDVDQQERILSYFENGEQSTNITEIAKSEGIGKSQILFFLYSKNIIPRTAGFFKVIELTESQRLSIVDLLNSHHTNQEICEELGLSRELVARFINEHRESQERKVSRHSESQTNIHSRLVSRQPDVIEIIMHERSLTHPTSYQRIADRLKEEKGVDATASTIRNIHLEELSKRK